MGETGIRRILYLAGGLNIIGGLGALADPSGHFSQMYTATLSLDDPLQAFFFRAVWINVIAWGVGYILAGRHPSACGPVLIAGGAGKLTYFAAGLAVFLNGIGSGLLLAFGLLDVAFAVFFFYVVWAQRTEER